MGIRVAGFVVGVVSFGAACNNNSTHEQPDARSPDAPPPRPDAAADAPYAAEPQLPAGTPVAIALTSIGGLAYTGPLAFGAQHFDVILDTGSTTLGVASTTCTNCGVTPLYAPGNGAVDQHQTASAQYADGSGWTGEIYQDSPALGDGPAVAVKLGAITSSNNFFRDFTGDGTAEYQGILGLGPDGALLTGTTSYLTAAFAAGTTAEIAFQLCPDGGTMWLGGYDASKQAGPQAVTPLTGGLPFYGVEVADLGVAGVSLHQSTTAFGPTIVDTGTSIAFIPSAPLGALTSAIEATPGFTTAFGSQSLADNGCVTTSMTGAQLDAMLPPIEVAFPGITSGTSPPVDLPATRSYLMDMGGGEWCFTFADSSELTGGSFSISLFGDSVLHAYVTTFDIADQRMGFAPQTGCDEPAIAAPQQHVVHAPGTPWWQHDPRVHYPSPAQIQRLVGALRHD
ncbi:MAG TPA: pepsin-like aspartic protease [Kofleriaceae bacterium]|nr:pepsin-like aspartic protease [Kofleriaceae bacterium]